MILTQVIAFQEFWRPFGVQSLTKLTEKVKPFYFIFVKKRMVSFIWKYNFVLNRLK